MRDYREIRKALEERVVELGKIPFEKLTMEEVFEFSSLVSTLEETKDIHAFLEKNHSTQK